MEKNWLIRTKSNHLLGPITKEKVLELLHNGSIKPDDEVCSGNGFWFFIREDDMVERFLTGNETQGFNPMSEAKDVLTGSSSSGPHNEDITLVGNLNLGGAPLGNGHTKEEMKSAPAESAKKKSDFERKLRPAVPREKPEVTSSKAPLKKQNYLLYLGILGFILLVLLIYYRNRVYNHILGQQVLSSFLIPPLYAQELPLKKKLLESEVKLENIVFAPQIGIDGFKVVSKLNIDEIKCEGLSNEVQQLAIILYPTDRINEKFLIKVRECVLKLPDDHPVKNWLKSIGEVRTASKEDQERRQFLIEVINSHFNLITDTSLKVKIANVLSGFPEETLPERLLKSYLYLILGNVTRSDNLLHDFINRPPYQNWKRGGMKHSLQHNLGTENLEQIVQKLGRHPSDRKTFGLLASYIASFYNEEGIREIFADNSPGLGDALKLRILEKTSPHLLAKLRLEGLDDSKRISMLRNQELYPQMDQAYWIWPFFDISPLISEDLYPTLREIEKKDELWFIYLMADEKLQDMYSKKNSQQHISHRRHFLRSLLKEKALFMLSLFKLIELGDVDAHLVNEVSQFYSNG